MKTVGKLVNGMISQKTEPEAAEAPKAEAEKAQPAQKAEPEAAEAPKAEAPKRKGAAPKAAGN